MDQFIRILESNPYLWLPLSLGFIILMQGYIKLWKLRRTEHPQLVSIFGSWLMGIIALLLGFFGHIKTTLDGMDAMAQMVDISPDIILDSAISGYHCTTTGLAVLIISLGVWGILKGVKDKRIGLMKLNE